MRMSAMLAMPCPRRAAMKPRRWRFPRDACGFRLGVPSLTSRTGWPIKWWSSRETGLDQGGERRVGEQQRGGRDEAAEEGVVAVDERVLDGVCDDDDEDKVEGRHLAELTGAEQSQAEDEEDVDDKGLRDLMLSVSASDGCEKTTLSPADQHVALALLIVVLIERRASGPTPRPLPPRGRGDDTGVERCKG